MKLEDIKKKASFSIVYVLIAFLIFALIQLWITPTIQSVPYSKFKKLISEGKINSVVVSQRYLRGTTRFKRVTRSRCFRIAFMSRLVWTILTWWISWSATTRRLSLRTRTPF